MKAKISYEIVNDANKVLSIYLLPIVVKDEQQIDRFYSNIIGKRVICDWNCNFPHTVVHKGIWTLIIDNFYEYILSFVWNFLKFHSHYHEPRLFVIILIKCKTNPKMYVEIAM